MDKAPIELKQEHHNKRALRDNLKRPRARIKLPARRSAARTIKQQPRLGILPSPTASSISAATADAASARLEEIRDGGPEILINPADEVEEGLNLGLEAGAEVAEEVEDDADADEAVLLVVSGEDVHGDLEEVLDEGAEDLAVGEAVEDLDDHVAELVLGVVAELRRRPLQQDRREGAEVAPEEVEVIRRVRDLEAVSDLHRHLESHLKLCSHEKQMKKQRKFSTQRKRSRERRSISRV